jgi:hypothetical protein
MLCANRSSLRRIGSSIIGRIAPGQRIASEPAIGSATSMSIARRRARAMEAPSLRRRARQRMLDASASPVLGHTGKLRIVPLNQPRLLRCQPPGRFGRDID